MHRLDFINSLNSSVRCYSCREIINSRFYDVYNHHAMLKFVNCVNAGRYYRTRSSYNPDDYITRYRYVPNLSEICIEFLQATDIAAIHLFLILIQITNSYLSSLNNTSDLMELIN